jgi:hypothetical protein
VKITFDEKMLKKYERLKEEAGAIQTPNSSDSAYT